MDKDNSISSRQFLAKFKRLVKDCGGTNEAAKYFNVKPTFIRNVSSGKELPGIKILKLMQLRPEKKILYRYKPIKGKS